jgi:hypothetical protein
MSSSQNIVSSASSTTTPNFATIHGASAIYMLPDDSPQPQFRNESTGPEWPSPLLVFATARDIASRRAWQIALYVPAIHPIYACGES